MSGTAIIRYMVANNGPVASIVAGRVISGIAPMNTELPAISIRGVSGREHELIKRTGAQLVTERIQVTVLAKTYAQQKQIMNLIRSAVTSTRDTVNTFSVDSISHELDGPDLYSEEPVTFEQSIDFIVRFYR